MLTECALLGPERGQSARRQFQTRATLQLKRAANKVRAETRVERLGQCLTN